jgi:hypothetical protein
MFRRLIRFDLLLVVLFFLFMVEKIFLFNTVVTPFFMIIFFIFVPFVYVLENKIKINIFMIFFSYIFIRTIFNILTPDKYLFEVGLTTTIQIISIALVIPAIYYIVEHHEKRINLIINTIQAFIFINTLILILSAFNIYILNTNLYESYGNRYFGIIGDQLPWIITFMIAYTLHHKKYFLLIFYFIGLIFSGSLNALAVALIIFFYYIYKKISFKNFFYIFTFTIIFFLLLDYFNVFWRLTSGQYHNSGDQRLLSFIYGINHINNYLFGNGYGTYSYINEQNMIDTATVSRTIFMSTFNQYLQLCVDLGIVGVVLFFIMFYRIVQLKTFKFSYIKIWIIMFLIFNQSAVWLLPSSYSWLLIAIGLGILIYENKKIEKNLSIQKEISVQKTI